MTPMTTVERIADLLKKATAIGVVLGIGYIGEKGSDGGFIKDVWAALKTASPPVAMVMFILFLDERRERRDCQKQLNERTVDFIQATNMANSSFERALIQIRGTGVSAVSILKRRKRRARK